MKVLKTLIAVLLTGVVLATLIGCSSNKADTTSNTQEYTVKKGDLSLTITAAGNLALSKTEDLAVDLFYTAGTKGTIGSIMVDEGDSVKEGQVLVTLDKDEWNDQMDTLQKTLTAAQRTVMTKSIAVSDAERQLALLQRQVPTTETAVTKAQRTVESKKLLVTSAELNVMSANNTLNNIIDVKKIQDNIDNAEYAIKFASKMMEGEFGGGVQLTDYTYWSLLKSNAQAQLIEYQNDKQELLSGTSTSADVALLVSQKVLALEQAKLALLDARQAVDDANLAVQTALIAVDDANYAITKQQQSLENARSDLKDANTTLADTQKKLTDAQSKSPEIKAPFDGFVTKINVSGGDEVLNGTVAVTVADPNLFEADILVNEMDIMKVALGGTATISLNSMTGVKLPAKITHIAPTATISSGVVNYMVKVEIDAQAASRLQQASTPAAATANTTGQAATALQRAVESGRMTQEQADALAAQGGAAGGFSARSGITLPEGFTPPAGAASSAASGSRATSQLPSTVTQNFQLKQGLTGTVELIVSQSINVLLVPNTAIIKAGNQRTVQVKKADGTSETRTVEVGLSDWQNTEITSGLSEGDKIIITKTATSSSPTTSTSQQGPQSIPFLGR